MSKFRQPTIADVAAIMMRLVDLKDQPNAAAHMKYADFKTAQAYIYDAASRGRALVRDGYFFLFSVSELWHTNQSFVIEDLFMRYRDTPIRAAEAASWWLDIREQIGMPLFVGDSQAGVMCKHYEALGFKPFGKQYIME